MNKEEILNAFLLANIPEIITQEEFNDVKKAIKQLQQENQKYKEVIDRAIKLLGNYRHYSMPDEKQNSDNEDLVNKAFDILKEVE